MSHLSSAGVCVVAEDRGGGGGGGGGRTVHYHFRHQFFMTSYPTPISPLPPPLRYSVCLSHILYACEAESFTAELEKGRQGFFLDEMLPKATEHFLQG